MLRSTIMNELGHAILEFLSRKDQPVPAPQIAFALKANAHSIMSILESLKQEGLVSLESQASRSKTVWLNAEGLSYYKDGTPERRLANIVRKQGKLEMEEAVQLAQLTPQEKQVAFKWSVQEGLLAFEKSEQKTLLRFKQDNRTLTEKALDVVAEMRIDEKMLSSDQLQNLKHRKLLEEKEEPRPVSASITQDGRLTLQSSQPKMVSQLTPQMLRDGSWKKASFRPYDLETAVVPTQYGKKQPYLQLIRQIKESLVSLGFQEADGPLVELEFWNMDVLFMPQDHPARDIHDVFHTNLPAGTIANKKLLSLVKKAHEFGIKGSKGWGYTWNESLARRIVLRSQTTTVSARALAKKLKPPLRVFSIGRVFRPDEIDWKHFIEFNQCEGIVADEKLSFRELLGYLKSFAVDIFGAEAVRFAPSYFPFTEPSVEMHAKIQDKWTEVGGAGMFRPEMLGALECDVPVLAWGLGLDRLAMKRLGVSDIRELFSQDLNYLRGT